MLSKYKEIILPEPVEELSTSRPLTMTKTLAEQRHMDFIKNTEDKKLKNIN